MNNNSVVDQSIADQNIVHAPVDEGEENCNGPAGAVLMTSKPAFPLNDTKIHPLGSSSPGKPLSNIKLPPIKGAAVLPPISGAEPQMPMV